MTDLAQDPKDSRDAATRSRWAWIGAGAGAVMGLADLLVLRAFDISVELAGRDVAVPVFVLLGLTYSYLGYLLGESFDTRRRLRRDADIIARQLVELRESQARALHYEKLASIGRLAAGVAHEVRNSLGVVRSSAALLCESLRRGDQEAQTAGRFIKEEVDRLDGFVRSLLDFSRPLAPARDEVDVARLLERARAVIGREGLTVELAVDSEAAHCRGDPDLLGQLVVALAVNAAEAGSRVQLSAHRHGAGVALEVADDGAGVAREQAERIFEPFFTTKARGTGLGLAMAQRIAEAHGGALVLADAHGLDGRGARFRLHLPDAAGRAEESAA